MKLMTQCTDAGESYVLGQFYYTIRLSKSKTKEKGHIIYNTDISYRNLEYLHIFIYYNTCYINVYSYLIYLALEYENSLSYFSSKTYTTSIL